jgi:hypothetical protein
LIAPASTSPAALATLEKACADATARAEYKTIAARLNVEALFAGRCLPQVVRRGLD